MKETCSLFQLIALEDIFSILDNKVDVPLESDIHKLTSDTLDISVKTDTTDAGTVYSVDQSITVDKADIKTITAFSVPRSAVLVVSYTDGTQTVYGSFCYPVVAYIVRGVQSDTLHISLKTVDSPII